MTTEFRVRLYGGSAKEKSLCWDSRSWDCAVADWDGCACASPFTTICTDYNNKTGQGRSRRVYQWANHAHQNCRTRKALRDHNFALKLTTQFCCISSFICLHLLSSCGLQRILYLKFVMTMDRFVLGRYSYTLLFTLWVKSQNVQQMGIKTLVVLSHEKLFKSIKLKLGAWIFLAGFTVLSVSYLVLGFSPGRESRNSSWRRDQIAAYNNKTN